MSKLRTSGNRRLGGFRHASTAQRLAAQPRVWGPVAEYRSRDTARGIGRQIREATFRGFVAYGPADSYETRIEMTDDGWLLEARYVGVPRIAARKLVYRTEWDGTPGELGVYITPRRLQVLGLLLKTQSPLSRAVVVGELGMCARTAHRILRFLVMNDWARSTRTPGKSGHFVYELTPSGRQEAQRLLDEDPLTDVPRETSGGEA